MSGRMGDNEESSSDQPLEIPEENPTPSTSTAQWTVRSAILDGTYFEIVKQTESGQVQAECKLCTKKKTIISGSVQATTNFKTHLKRLHAEVLPEFEQHKQGFSSGKKRTIGTTLKQTKLFTECSPRNAQISQKKVDDLITAYVVKGMHPLSTVEQPEFIDLVEGLNPEATVISRRTLGRRIDNDFTTKVDDLKEVLKGVKHLCTTADIWSTKVSSFFGVTAHWIQPDTLGRLSTALACRHFPSPHTYDRIAETLDEIHAEYGLSHERIVATVTDNASNFVKAFKEFNISAVCVDEESQNDEEDLSFIAIDSSDSEENENGIILPTHLRCACHTLSLVATIDAKKAMKENSSLSRLNNSTMGKCSALWNAAGRPKSAEVVSAVLKFRLITPCATRWNSLYDSLHQLCSIHETLPDLMKQLNLPLYKDAEMEYIEEYTKVLKPLAQAIDRLQSQSPCYYAELIPTLFAIEGKLEALHANNLRYCSHLLHAIVDGFHRRFGAFLDLRPEVNEAILASVTHPYFKMRWLPPHLAGKKKRIQELMLQAATDLGLVTESEASNATSAVEEEDDFFIFTEDVEVFQKSTHSKAELESLHFLEDQRKDLPSLDQYPLIKNLFVRFNTIIPSSAPVERLFSFAGLINRPHRRRLNANLFEKLVVLKGIN